MRKYLFALLLVTAAPDARRPGEPSPAAPDMLFVPCPLSPRNLPDLSERDA